MKLIEITEGKMKTLDLYRQGELPFDTSMRCVGLYEYGFFYYSKFHASDKKQSAKIFRSKINSDIRKSGAKSAFLLSTPTVSSKIIMFKTELEWMEAINARSPSKLRKV